MDSATLNRKVYEYFDLINTLRDKPMIEMYHDECTSIQPFVGAMKKQKLTEDEYKGTATRHGDRYNLEERFGHGLIGELSVEKLVDAEFVDRTIGDSKKYIGNDLSRLGISCGVKTAKWNNTPMIPIQPRYPEIIVILTTFIDPKRGGDVRYIAIICGIASKEVQLKYSDNDLIKSGDAKYKKNGFYGFDKLVNVYCLDDVERVVKEMNGR